MMKRLIRYVRQKLSVQLSLAIVLLTVPVFVVSLGSLFVKSRSLISQEAIKRAVSSLNTTTLRLERVMNSVEVATDVNAWFVEEHFQPETMLRYSRIIMQMNRSVSGCSISAEPDAFPEEGRCFSAYSVRMGDSISTLREEPYEYFDEVWYKTPVAQQKACWVDPFSEDEENALSPKNLIASYCRPLRNKEGKVIGVLSSDLALSQLAEIITAQKPYPNAYFVLLGTEGRYFVHPDSARLITKTIFNMADANEHPDIIALGHEMVTGQQGSMRVIVDDEPCLVCYRPVPGTQWSLALVSPRSDIFKNYNRLTLIIIPLIVIGLAIILLFSHHTVGRNVRPLRQLLRQSQLIAEGQYGEKYATTTRNDVIGLLQNSFAKMQQSIDRHVSDIKQVNEETRQRNEELQQARQMVDEAARQKTIFIQNMIHQIRTPLNIITGFAQVMCDNHAMISEEELKTITGMMDHNARILNRIVLMLYDSSETGRSETEKAIVREEVGCNDVARESIAYAQRLFPYLKMDFQTTLPDTFTISTDRLYLVRCLRELLCNSAKYSDGANITLSISRSATSVSFVVQDVGPGIPADIMERMFLPFTKVNDLSEGLGLGLPLTKSHSLALGGDLTLDPDYHDGCRFILEIRI